MSEPNFEDTLLACVKCSVYMEHVGAQVTNGEQFREFKCPVCGNIVHLAEFVVDALKLEA